MTVEEFREQIRQAGLNVRKQKNLEKFDVRHGDLAIFSVYYSQIYHLKDISQLLAQHQTSSYASPQEVKGEA